MDRVLISGGGGRLGRRVLSGWDLDHLLPVAPSRAQCDFLDARAVDAMLDDVEPSVFLHLAWSASSVPDYRDHADNQRWSQATRHLAAVCLARGVHPVLVGSGLDAMAEPTDEYTRAKAALRRELAPLIASAAVTWVRPFFVVDLEDPWPRVVKSLVDARRRDEVALLMAPEAANDFVLIEDVAAALRLLVARRPGGVVDIASGEPHTPRDLADRLGVSWHASDHAEPTSGSRADINRLMRFGWRPSHTKEWFSG